MNDLIKRLRDMGNGLAEPMIGDYDEAADEMEVKDAIIAELLEALAFAKTQARVASGMGVTAAQIHTRVEIDQIRTHYKLPSPQQQEMK